MSEPASFGWNKRLFAQASAIEIKSPLLPAGCAQSSVCNVAFVYFVGALFWFLFVEVSCLIQRLVGRYRRKKKRVIPSDLFVFCAVGASIDESETFHLFAL